MAMLMMYPDCKVGAKYIQPFHGSVSKMICYPVLVITTELQRTRVVDSDPARGGRGIPNVARDIMFRTVTFLIRATYLITMYIIFYNYEWTIHKRCKVHLYVQIDCAQKMHS